MPTREASARWTGDLPSGTGTVTLPAAGYEGRYSFRSRFGDGEGGTNPEELIAAAHAGCFSMAFAGDLATAGHVPDHVATTARVHVEPDGGGFSITQIDLVCEASVPGLDAEEFARLAEGAKANCPVSKLLAAAKITLDATLTPA